MTTTMTIRQMLAQAVRHHQAGRLTDAEFTYRDVLAMRPSDPDAMHLLGVLLAQRGRRPEAIDLIERAIAINPDNADYHGNLGSILVIDQLKRAIPAYRKSLALRPDNATIWSNLADALRVDGELHEALLAARRGVELAPDRAGGWHNLALVLRDDDEADECIAACRRALSLDSRFALAYRTLGEALVKQNQGAEAIAAFSRAIELAPTDFEAYDGLGVALQAEGKWEAAIAAHRQALEFQPKFSGAYMNLGNVYSAMGRHADAIENYRRVIALNPELVEGYYSLANALKSDGQLDEAIAAYHRGLGIKPRHGQSIHMLAGTLLECARHDESLAMFMQTREIIPDDLSAHSNLLYTMHFNPRVEPREIFQHHLEYDRLRVRPLADSILPHENDPSPDRRLRIGYVSPDFRLHSVAHFILPIIENHDRETCEVYCYYGAVKEDDITARFKSAAAQWRKIAHCDPEKAAKMVRDDGIDILVDLSGHTGSNRLMLFARKPAPVQVSYVGYPNTTGLSTMDYRLTDAHADPSAASDALCSEWLMRLPRTAWCYSPISGSPPVGRSPMLENGHITFGCFGAMTKLNPGLLSLWARILLATPGSRLLLKNRSLKCQSVRDWIIATMESAGLPPDRLEMMAWDSAVEDHLRTYDRVDIALDTYPYHGTTNTCESIWMGVPVVTLAGPTHVSRVGVSLLAQVGLADLIASRPDELVRIAAELAKNPIRLTDIRSTLRRQMQNSPLMDGPAMARDMEAAYRAMWGQWRRNHSA